MDEQEKDRPLATEGDAETRSAPRLSRQMTYGPDKLSGRSSKSNQSSRLQEQVRRLQTKQAEAPLIPERKGTLIKSRGTESDEKLKNLPTISREDLKKQEIEKLKSKDPRLSIQQHVSELKFQE